MSKRVLRVYFNKSGRLLVLIASSHFRKGIIIVITILLLEVILIKGMVILIQILKGIKAKSRLQVGCSSSSSRQLLRSHSRDVLRMAKCNKNNHHNHNNHNNNNWVNRRCNLNTCSSSNNTRNREKAKVVWEWINHLLEELIF